MKSEGNLLCDSQTHDHFKQRAEAKLLEEWAGGRGDHKKPTFVWC